MAYTSRRKLNRPYLLSQNGRKTGLTYRFRLDPQTPVGMATPLVHLNPTHFADPLSFNPERFIADPRLKRNLMSFSHGSRQCLGMQLAYVEMYLVNSAIWRRYGTREEPGEEGWLELFETDRSDVEMAADMFVVSLLLSLTGLSLLVIRAVEGTC